MVSNLPEEDMALTLDWAWAISWFLQLSMGKK
jgi:hypothetical protein